MPVLPIPVLTPTELPLLAPARTINSVHGMYHSLQSLVVAIADVVVEEIVTYF